MPARALPQPNPDAMADLAGLLAAMPPDELGLFVTQLAPEDRRLVEQLLAEHTAVGWRAHPAAMAEHLDPTYRRRRYIDLLSHTFARACDGTGRRIIINLPGRAGKTTLLQWGLVWLLDHRPRSKSIFTSYGDQLANESAIAVRDLLRQYHGALRVTLRRDRQKQDLFRTTEGGGLLAAGLFATITGYGVSPDGVLIVDDPYKHWAEAHSEAARRKIATQFKGTLRNRLDDEDAGILVVHHRMHHEDLTATLLADAADETGEEWEVVSLPALAVPADPERGIPPDPLGREPGETLDPKAFPVEKVQRRAKALGSYLAAALEQQNPTPEEGNEVRRAWFDVVDGGQLPQQWDQALTSWDLKLKNKEAGDYVVGQVWLRTGADYWLVDQLRGQYDHATTANAIALLAVRHPRVTSHVVEAAGSHDEVLPQLRKPRPDYVVTPEMAGRLGMTLAEAAQVQALRRRGMSGLIAHPVTEGSKPVRVRTFTVPAAEAGNVHVLLANWTPGYLDEHASFPTGANDDQVDATSQALQRMGVGQATAKAPAGTLPAPTPGAHRTMTPVASGRGASVSVPGRRPLRLPGR